MNRDIAASLRKMIEGDVLSDEYTRCMYSTDASAYEIMPICIAIPRHTEDVIKIVRFAYANKIPVIARGGGSGLAGQAIGAGIIIDFKYMKRILEINTKENYVEVEPGIYKGVLDKELKRYGKFLPPDPSSSNYCTIGGMIATNASGAHTVKYGSTIDYLLSLDVVLADGTLIHAEPIELEKIEDNREGRIYKYLANIIGENLTLIKENFPNVSKNSCGYRIDRVINNGVLNIHKLFAASEGTLGIIVKAKLAIRDLPSKRALAILGFSNTYEAAKDVKRILELKPSALELLDNTVVEMARSASKEFAEKVQGANSLLFVEFDGEEVKGSIETLKKESDKCLAYSYDDKEINELWGIRKNALAYTMKIREGKKKPIAFMEDPVVSANDLGSLVSALEQIYNKYGLKYVIYGHAGNGNLHTRPLLDLSNTKDLEVMREVTLAILNRVISVNGSISAEHGDGLARSEFIKDVYGKDLFDIFVKIKEFLDPYNIMNPGKKVVTKSVFLQNFRYGYERNEKAILNWGIRQSIDGKRITGYSTELSYEDEVDLCHGCGACRELNYGTRMCPVYKGLNNEEASCRGRNNVLRWMQKLHGVSENFALTDQYRDLIYKYCIQCKMCLIDCPSNVNVGKIMAEARARYARVRGLPKGYKYFVDIDRYAEIGCKLAPLSNILMESKIFRSIMERATGIDARKRFPKFSRRKFEHMLEEYRQSSDINPKKSVALFADTYLRYNDPYTGLKIVKIFEKNGYDVVFPEQRSSGLPALLEGDPEKGREIAELNIKSLYEYVSKGIPIITFSPSSLLALRMEYLNVIDNEESRAVAANTYDMHEFLSNIYDQGELREFMPIDEDVGIHFHCHTLVQDVDKHVMKLLNLIPSLRIDVIEKGCCGVGGSYSFIKENYDLSMSIGKELFEIIKDRNNVYTTGESCRLQMEEGSGKSIGLTVDLLAKAYGII